MLTDPETNPETVEETTPESAQTTTDGENAGGGESNQRDPEASQETVSLEQLQQTITEQNQKITDLNAGFTQASQDRAELKGREAQYQRMLGAVVDKEQAQADPYATLEKEYQQALFEGREQDALAARNKQRQIDRNAFLGEAMQAFDLKASIGKAQESYGYGANEINETYGNMTPEEIATVRAMREGKYEDHQAKRQQEAQQHAAHAAAVGRLVGEGTPGAVPGGFAPQPQKRINDITFGLLGKAKQKKLIEDGFEVFNNRTGEAIQV